MLNVPNQFPTVPSHTSRLAIIGEAPGQDEETVGKPFVGAAGRLLKSILSNAGLAGDMCFLGNVTQVRPSDNDITSFDWYGLEVQDGLAQLKTDLHAYKPHCILALGRAAVRAFVPSLVKYEDDGTGNLPISKWRGSILQAESDLGPPGYGKVVASYHPSYILRQYGDLPLFKFDINRAVKQSKFPNLDLPKRTISIRPAVAEVLAYLHRITSNRLRAAFDIEGYADNIGITMVSIAISPLDCLVIPFFLGGNHYWSADDELLVWKALADWLADPNCEKVCHNATYELFVLAWNHKLRVTAVTGDTMFKHFELFPELEKRLSLCASIYTHEPYYKDDRNSTDETTKLLYNGKDSCVTIETDEATEDSLRKVARSYDHYRFNISLLPAVNYLGLRGCKFDFQAAQGELTKTQVRLDLLSEELAHQIGRTINPKSVLDKQWFLYEFLGYDEYKRYGRTTKEEVLLRYYAKHRDPRLKLLLELVSLRTRKSDIGKLTTDADGRIRSNYNLVGTNTARISSSSSSARIHYFTKTGILKWDFTGTNLQNVTKDLRICFVPDTSNHAFFQCDLSGADGWTVAADLAALGHPTMLDDYLAGIRPAKVLLLMLEEYEAGRNPASINELDRATIRQRTKAIKFPDGLDEHGRQGDWKYLCMKRVQHGSNYGMEPDKLSATIFKDSEGTIDLSTREAGIYQYLYKLRYNPTARIDWVRRELRDKGFIQTAAGFRRQFFGIRNRSQPDDDVVREALALEPQANTTYVCNKALQSLWYDPTNRTSKSTLFVDPLLQVHDAVAGQFNRRHADFAIEKLRAWFHHPLMIHGIQVAIPFEGGYGTDWKHCKEVEFST